MEDHKINELCRERKEALHMTYREIAEISNLSEDTVTKYLNRISPKAPSVYTVGPICAALGVSLDKYFGINAPEKTSEERISELQERLAYSKKAHSMLIRTIFVLSVCCVIFFLYAFAMDLFHPLAGFFRH